MSHPGGLLTLTAVTFCPVIAARLSWSPDARNSNSNIVYYDSIDERHSICRATAIKIIGSDTLIYAGDRCWFMIDINFAFNDYRGNRGRIFDNNAAIGSFRKCGRCIFPDSKAGRWSQQVIKKYVRAESRRRRSGGKSDGKKPKRALSSFLLCSSVNPWKSGQTVLLYPTYIYKASC